MEDDAEELALRVDENREYLRRWASWVDRTTTRSDSQKFVRTCLESAISGTGYHYALLLDAEIVGLVTFNTIEKINRCATLGYWLAKSQTGRGLMTTAAKALIREGFRQLEFEFKRGSPLETIPVKLSVRLGLKKEGVLRQAEWVNDHFVEMRVVSTLSTGRKKPETIEYACKLF